MAVSATNLRNKRGIVDYAIYRSGNIYLFVPTEAMLLVHEESSEISIAGRAGLWNGVAFRWRERNPDKPWLMDFLYNEIATPKNSDFSPTNEMLAFRNEATVEAILRCVLPRAREEIAKRQRLGLGDGGLRISTSSGIRKWLKRWRMHHAEELPWFQSWLLRGQRPPENVKVVSAGEIRRHTMAWDYVSHCKKAGLAFETYLKWLGKKKWIPSIAWLKWLYGAVSPPGVLVVSQNLLALRSATTPARLLRIARTNDRRFAAWQKNPALSAALNDAIRAADAGTLEKQIPASLTNLKCRTAMIKYAIAQTLEQRCKAAGISIETYEQALRDADLYGVREHLERYIGSLPPYEQTTARKAGRKLAQYGLVKPNFFIASKSMWAFREIARQEWSRQRLSWTGNHPAFDQWFVDWTTAEARYGSSQRFAANDAPAGTSPPTVILETQERIDERLTQAFPSAGKTRHDETAATNEQSSRQSTDLPKKRSRGRPRGQTGDVAKRDRQILDAWGLDQQRPAEERKYRSYTSLAEEFNLDRSYVGNLIRAAKKKMKNKRTRFSSQIEENN